MRNEYNLGRRFAKARLPRLYGYLPSREQTIVGFFLHSTRSGSCGNPREAEGTENWINNPNNPGGAYDGLVGLDGQQIKASHWEQNEQPLWAGGWGGDGTWNAQQYYIHIEIAQGCIDDPYTEAQVESVAQWVAEESVKRGFAIQHIAYLKQYGAPPEGVCSHDASANGTKLGKSDPGYQWPWDVFVARAIQRAREYTGQGEEDMPDPRVDGLITQVAGLANAVERLTKIVAGNGIAPKGIIVDLDGKVMNPDGSVPLELITGEDAVDFLVRNGSSLHLGIAIVEAEGRSLIAEEHREKTQGTV